MLPSHVYLHDVLDRWRERMVNPRLPGEAYLVRDLDDCVGCFQLQANALARLSEKVPLEAS